MMLSVIVQGLCVLNIFFLPRTHRKHKRAGSLAQAEPRTASNTQLGSTQESKYP